MFLVPWVRVHHQGAELRRAITRHTTLLHKPKASNLQPYTALHLKSLQARNPEATLFQDSFRCLLGSRAFLCARRGALRARPSDNPLCAGVYGEFFRDIYGAVCCWIGGFLSRLWLNWGSGG